MEGWILAVIAAVLGVIGFFVLRARGENKGSEAKPAALGGASASVAGASDSGASASGKSASSAGASGAGAAASGKSASGSGASASGKSASDSGAGSASSDGSDANEPAPASAGGPPPSDAGAEAGTEGTPPTTVPFGKPAADLTAIAPFDSAASAFGLLVSAVTKGEVEEPTWIKVEWDGLELTVGAHALRAKVGNHLLRLPVTWKETQTICKKLGLCPPTSDISDAIWKAATVRAAPVPMGNFSTPEKAAATSKKMSKLEYALVHNENVDSEIPADKFQELCGTEGKDWILSKRNLTKPGAATTYGFHQTSGKPIQGLGSDNTPPAHNDDHFDQTQVLRPIQRAARRLSDGAVTDLTAELKTRGLPAACLKGL